ncbi:MAG TPA: 5'-nucleotidase C-terminal domain-containing protein [Pyrinomonadaceae bacterium]|nr:5'-nucleotidase C-terminal domain-containing protein [Pyrinomonadaceae bacterium]
MSKPIQHANKTRVSSKLLLACFFVLGLLVFGHSEVFAQQAQTIQPCEVKKPCTVEPTTARKSTPAPRRTSSGRRKPANKRTSTKTTLSTKSESRVSETVIDATIPADAAVEKMLEPYSAKVRALDAVIGKLESDLSKSSIGAGTLGNFVADGIRAYSSKRLGKSVVMAVTNNGGLRKNTITAGELRAADIFELLPFENALIEIDLTGEQLRRLLSIVTSGRDAQSGARIKYRIIEENRPQLISVALVDQNGKEIQIDPEATYTIVTIDYLLKLGSGNYAILQEGKNAKPIGITIRDAIMDYVKSETAAGRPIKPTSDDRFTLVDPEQSKPNP